MDTEETQVTTDQSTITINVPESDAVDNPQDVPISPEDFKAKIDNAEKKAEQDYKDMGEKFIQPTKAVPGEIVGKAKEGHPTKYNEAMQKIADDYFELCNGSTDGKKRLPLIEELARLCRVDSDTINNWTDDFPQFFGTIKRIKELQKESIIKRGFAMKNPTFAIFMLKANHGMIETEKRILAGERNSEPVHFSVTNFEQKNTEAKQLLEEATS